MHTSLIARLKDALRQHPDLLAETISALGDVPTFELDDARRAAGHLADEHSLSDAVESALADDIVWYRGDAQTAEAAAAEIFARDYPDFAT